MTVLALCRSLEEIRGPKTKPEALNLMLKRFHKTWKSTSLTLGLAGKFGVSDWDVGLRVGNFRLWGIAPTAVHVPGTEEGNYVTKLITQFNGNLVPCWSVLASVHVFWIPFSSSSRRPGKPPARLSCSQKALSIEPRLSPREEAKARRRTPARAWLSPRKTSTEARTRQPECGEFRAWAWRCRVEGFGLWFWTGITLLSIFGIRRFCDKFCCLNESFVLPGNGGGLAGQH